MEGFNIKNVIIDSVEFALYEYIKTTQTALGCKKREVFIFVPVQ